MKNRRKQGKIFRSLLAVLMLTAMLVTTVLQPVFAGDYEAGKQGNLTLTIQQTSEDGTTQTPIQGVGLTIYKVGSVNFDGNVHFVLDGALASTGIDLGTLTTADDWYSAADTLAGAVAAAGITGTSGSSDAEGKMTFANLDEGMYLVVQSDANSNVAVSPMLLSIPFADQEQGWLYDVQAYPKTATVPKQTQIQVTKRIYNMDESMNVIPLTAEDATYKVGLFVDQQGTIPYGEPQDIHIQNASSGTATWTDVPDGTYYVYELDADGNTLQQDDEIRVDDQTSYYYSVTGEDILGGDASQIVIGGDSNNTEAVAYVNNIYSTVPDGYARTGYIDIKKNVQVDGNVSTVDDTFYAGIFTKENDGTLNLEQVVTLNQNNTVHVTFELPSDEENGSYTYTVLETDKDGNPVEDDAAFPYTVSGGGEITLNNDNRYIGSMEITNSISSEPTPSVTPGTTPGGNNRITPVPGNSTPGNTAPNDTSGTARRSVRTGDNTPIGVWVGILAAAVVIGGGAAFAVKRKKKK